jgi:hypothetical protein
MSEQNNGLPRRSPGQYERVKSRQAIVGKPPGQPELRVPFASSRDISHFAGKLSTGRALFPSMDEQRGRDGVILLLAE